MTVLIKNPQTDALIRRVAELKGVGLTEAVHQALENELKRESHNSPYVERGLAFVKRLHERSNPALGLPVDKEFIDSLYDDD